MHRHQGTSRATRCSERVLAVKDSKSQTNTEQEPQHSVKQGSRNRSIGSEKHVRDLESPESIERPGKRLQTQNAPKANPLEQVLSEINIGDIEDDKYVSEFQDEVEIADNYFKISVPYAAELSQGILQLQAKYGGRRPPKDVLADLLRPRMSQFQAELEQKGEEVKSHLLELWDLKDEWKYPVDNVFAAPFFKQIAQSDPHPYSSEVCEHCSTVDIDEPISLSEFKGRATSCGLCRILSQCHIDIKDNTQITLLDRRSIVRVCGAPEPKGVRSKVQIGFPSLPGLETRFKLFSEWLQLCNETHKDFGCHLASSSRLPTRVLDVGDGNLRLHISEPGDQGDYVVLSHCWGNLPEDQKKQFCTSWDNIDSRCRDQGIDVGALPKTFLDAITVTRKLGKRYLWIDSLCIIQYGDNLEDWKKESEQMGAIFRNAYCTIAATSAKDPTEGFLARPARDCIQPRYVKVHSPSYGSVYISRVIDDYHSDVENGVLNQRAWVLQERALSRRTIHFTATQTYWECGEGVRCETLTRMRNSKALFLGDPTFPAFLKHRRARDNVELFQQLFSRYSQLGLTNSVDRPIAIAGLVDRLAETFEMIAKHGTFDRYLHRSLLWHRSGPLRLQRILYATDRKVPSWSWMAYAGRIEYMGIKYYHVEWNESVRFVDSLLKAPVRNFQSCKIERKDNETCNIENENGYGEKGWLKFDGEDSTDVLTLRCVILGRDRESYANQRYYVLVVTPLWLEEGCKTFERVGVGSIPQGFISPRDGVVDAHIL